MRSSSRSPLEVLDPPTQGNHTMLNFLLALPLSLVTAPQTPPPDTKRVEAAVAELDAAFKTGKAEDKIRAIRSAMEIPDGKVIEGIARGLKDDDPTVKRGTVEALGRMRHPDALESLHAFVKGSRA